MTCKSCAERRKALRERREAKRLARKHFQAAAIGAVLSVSEAAGNVLGINGEIENDRQQPSSSGHEKATAPAESTISEQSGREAHEE